MPTRAILPISLKKVSKGMGPNQSRLLTTRGSRAEEPGGGVRRVRRVRSMPRVFASMMSSDKIGRSSDLPVNEN